MTDNGASELFTKFDTEKVDGKILVYLTVQELENTFDVKSLGKRKSIMRRIVELNAAASRYLSCREQSMTRRSLSFLDNTSNMNDQRNHSFFQPSLASSSMMAPGYDNANLTANFSIMRK